MAMTEGQVAFVNTMGFDAFCYKDGFIHCSSKILDVHTYSRYVTSVTKQAARIGKCSAHGMQFIVDCVYPDFVSGWLVGEDKDGQLRILRATREDEQKIDEETANALIIKAAEDTAHEMIDEKEAEIRRATDSIRSYNALLASIGLPKYHPGLR